MDDLKDYGESRHALVKTIKVVADVPAAVGMSLGTKKFAVAHMIAGKVVEEGDIPLKTGVTMLEVKCGKTYRYLGVPQLLGADLKKTKQRSPGNTSYASARPGVLN